MIGSLEGVIRQRSPRRLLLEVGGIGYLIYVSDETLRQLPTGNEPIRLLTHLVVREEALDLYGFFDPAELEYFQLLINVSGIGPKSALGILSIASPETLGHAVAENDVAYLTQVSGIGRKSAEKIILELRDKVGVVASVDKAGGLAGEKDALLALEALGYSRDEARDALRQTPATASSLNDRLTAALRFLGRK